MLCGGDLGRPSTGNPDPMNVQTLNGHDMARIDLEMEELKGKGPEHEPDLPDPYKRLLVLRVDLKTGTD